MDCLVCGYRDGEWVRCPRCGTHLAALLERDVATLDVSTLRTA